MGQPAARLTDMHVCPMVTPAVPPIPHVGGPIMGPGVPTVLIGKMPAVVIGDMCTCVGPPDSIVKGSMTVLIGGRPAARMGDLTVHGGSIVMGCFTVLIGDAPGSGAVSLNVSPVSVMVNPVVIPPIVFQNMPPETADVTNENSGMQDAAANGTPTVDACPDGGDTGSGPDPAMPPEEEDDDPKFLDSYYTDADGNRVEAVQPGETIYFVIESQNMTGETISINLNGEGINYEYQGEVLEDDVLDIDINSDTEQIELKVIAEVEETEPALPENPLRPKVLESCFVNEQGVKLEEVTEGDVVYLLLKTQFLIGKEVTIQFDISGVDYEYEGRILLNDSLTVTIESDEHLVKLDVIEEPDPTYDNDNSQQPV